MTQYSSLPCKNAIEVGYIPENAALAINFQDDATCNWTTTIVFSK